MDDSKYLILGLFIVMSTLIQVCYAQRGNAHHGGLSLSREYLLALNNRVHHDSDYLSNIDFPPGMTRNNTKPLRKRGRKGGVRQRLRKMKHKPPLPSMILANVRCLKGLKMDELRANATFFNEYRDACLMAFTETWFDQNVGDRGTFIKGFGCPTRLDRDKQTTGKAKGGGVCLYVNERWCKTVIVREQLCTPDIELLSVSLRPLYLPPRISTIVCDCCVHTPQSQRGSCRPAYL